MPNRVQSLRLAAIVFTDIVGYSAVVNRNSVLAAKLLDRQRSVVRKCVHTYGGREVETAGDSFLLEFHSALKALECVAEIQRRLRQVNDFHSETESVQIRASVHLGDVEHRSKEVFGDGVNIAARILPFSPPGGVAFSDVVQHQVRTRVEVRSHSLGRQILKNIAEPIEIFILDFQLLSAIQSAAIPEPGKPVRQASHSWWWLLSLAFTVFVGLGTAALHLLARSPSVTPADHRAIAVLPFANLNHENADDYLAEGIQESLLTDLASIGSLKVISRTSVMYYKNKTVPLRQIGRELGVGVVVEGSVQHQGERLLVHVQLIDAATDQHLWAQSYNRPLDDLFAVESDLATEISAAVDISLTPQMKETIDRKPTSSPEAYRLFVEAEQLRNRREATKEENLSAEEKLKQAIVLDPTFALAYIKLSEFYQADFGNSFDRSDRKLELARAALSSAAKLEPDAPELHLALGDYYYNGSLNLDAAQPEYEAVLGAQPSSADAHEAVARVLRRRGQLTEAISHFERAVQLDPKNWGTMRNLRTSFQIARNYAAALSVADRLVALDPSDYSEILNREWIRFEQSGDLSAVKKALQDAPPEYWNHDPDGANLDAESYTIVWGDFDDAIAFAQKLPSLILQEFGDEPCPRESILAHLYWMKGDHLQALQLYRKAATVLESDLREKDSTSTNAIQRGSLAEAYAALGRSVDAQRVLDRLKASAAYSDPFRRELLTHTLAYTYLLLGQKDAALDQLEVGLTQPSFMSAQEIRISPDFAALHGNQRFADILTRSQALADSVR